MGRQGGMSYDEITRSGTLGERLDLQYLLGNLDKITYGSDSLFFLPVWIYILLGVSFFLRLTRLTVLLSAMTVILGLVSCGHASGLLGFLYRHIFFFAYFRNLFFFGAFLVPLVIVLGTVSIANAVEYSPQGRQCSKRDYLRGYCFACRSFFGFKTFSRSARGFFCDLGRFRRSFSDLLCRRLSFVPQTVDRPFRGSFDSAARVDT